MSRDGIAEGRGSGDAPDAPAPGEIHVWRVELPDGDRRGAARRALTAILAGYLGGEDEVSLGVGERGKPRLAREPRRLSFNLSHSAGLALVAVAPGEVEVGVDVELLRARRDLARLAARWLPAADAAAVAAAAADRRRRIFYAAWTRHEARVKCVGTGLSGPPPGPEIVARPLAADEGYAAAVAVDERAAGFRAGFSLRRLDFGAPAGERRAGGWDGART